MNPKVAHTLAAASKAVYLEAAEVENWASDYGFNEFRWIEADDTQAAVLETPERQIVAFRGTDEVRDWLTNLDAWKVQREFKGEVHQGFYDALMVVWGDIAPLLSTEKLLYFTGHSLGGALATLARASVRFGVLYTFGSPRVGDSEFTEAFTPAAYRFTNNNDLVTRVPIGDYSHVGEHYHFTHTGKMWHNPSGWAVEADRLVSRFLKFRVADGIRDHSMDEYIRLVSKQRVDPYSFF